MAHCRLGGPSHDRCDHYALWPVVRGARRDGGLHDRYVSQGGFGYDCAPGPRVATVARTAAAFTWSCHAGGTLAHRLVRAAIVWRKGQPVMFAARARCGAISCLAQWGDVAPDGYEPCRICDAVAA